MKKRDVIVILVLILGALSLLFFIKPNTNPPVKIEEASPTPTMIAPIQNTTDSVITTKETLLPANTEISTQTLADIKGIQAFIRVGVGPKTAIPYPLVGEGDLTFAQDQGQENIVHYTATGFHMKDSNCDGQDCINQGEVTLENKDRRILSNMVICLPNQVAISLITPEEAQNYLPKDVPLTISTPQEAKEYWEQHYDFE